MLLQIPVFDSLQVSDYRLKLDESEWIDGRVTAGHQSAKAKNNMQLPENHPVARQLGNQIVSALEKNSLFLAAALPMKVFPPLFNRYTGDQSFGNHVDNAVRYVADTHDRVRTDLAATLFLSSPEEYDGGELLIEDTYGVHSVKLAAGQMILYPASSLHRVEAVSRGTRTAAFLWVQSMVRDDSKRTLLFDLDVAIQRLTQDVPEHPSVLHLTGVYHNLMRSWADC